MAESDDEPPEPYRLSDEPPPGRRYRPMPGVRASSARGPDKFDKPALRRFLGTDPFPWALALCVVIWVGLGLGNRSWAGCSVVLGFAGMAVIGLSLLWLYLSLFFDDPRDGAVGLISRWYQTLYVRTYLYNYPEVAWRPGLLAFVGFLMTVTAFGLGISHLRDR